MKITAASHTDHALTEAHIAFLMALFASRTAFFKETVELPAHLASLPCNLHADVPENEVTYKVRGDRPYASRVCNRAPVASRLLTVIGGPHEGEMILYTAFGGPSAMREPGDASMPESEREASIAFWKTHALGE